MSQGQDGNGHAKPAPRRLAILGMPGYGEATMGAARGFWRSSRNPELQVESHYTEGSLLANNFNQLWVEALNAARSGRPPAYFAMIHADVEPEDWWLDVLVGELESHSLDIVGAVVPIKDQRGVTSLALQGGEREPWSPLCRLTMTDVFRLPPTFTSDDIGHPLLLNTGLWACRFDEAWAKKVHFEINDAIKFHEPSGKYQTVNESEDWYFSRLCHELRLKVGATRKVRLTHRGPTQYPNDRAWGSCSWDAASQAASPLVDEPPSGRFVLPAIQGWLSYAEGERLAELARGKRVLEVGSYEGLSTVCMARTAMEVVSVDTHDGRGTAVPNQTYDKMIANLIRYGAREKVVAYTGTLAEADEDDGFGPGYPFDLIFIDGAHDRASVESDIRHALPLLTPDGLLAFHDYRSPIDPDVTAVVDELIGSGSGAELVSLVDSLAVVRPPASIPSPLQPLEV